MTKLNLKNQIKILFTNSRHKHITTNNVDCNRIKQQKKIIGDYKPGNLYGTIGLVGTLFANGLGDLGSVPSYVVPNTLKMVLDTPLLKTQQYKVPFKGKVEQSKGRSSALLSTSSDNIPSQYPYLPSYKNFK